jgi:hypothetical protein
MGRGARLDGIGKSHPHRRLNPEPSSPQCSRYTDYPIPNGNWEAELLISDTHELFQYLIVECLSLTWLLIALFILGLLRDVLSLSDYTAPNDRMNSE